MHHDYYREIAQLTSDYPCPRHVKPCSTSIFHWHLFGAVQLIYRLKECRHSSSKFGTLGDCSPPSPPPIQA